MSDETKKPLDEDTPAEQEGVTEEPQAEEPSTDTPDTDAESGEAPVQAELSDDPSALGHDDAEADSDNGVEDPEVAALHEDAADDPSTGSSGDGGEPPVPADMAGDFDDEDGGDDEGDEGDEDEDGEEGSMSFTEHLQELRQRLTRCALALIVGFLACYGFSKQLFDLLMRPLVTVFPPGSHLIFTALPEAFFTYIKVALVAGFFLMSPYIFYQLWLFIAPGLYKEERKYLIPIGFFSAIFFVVGASFGYFVVFPFAFKFFMGFTTEFIKPFPKLDEYLGFSLKLLFAFGVIFELPLVIFFLARLGLVTSAMLRKARKFAILCCFVISAILTPPDVVSQLLMAGPLMLLYEISIYVAQFFGRREKRHVEEEEEEEEEGEEENEDAEDSTEEESA